MFWAFHTPRSNSLAMDVLQGVRPLDGSIDDVRIAIYEGQCVTLLSYPQSTAPERLELELNLSAECLGLLSPSSLPERKCMVFDFAFNTRYVDLVELGSFVRGALQRRIAHETLRRAISLHRHGVSLDPEHVLLDFGLRPKLGAFLSQPVQSKKDEKQQRDEMRKLCDSENYFNSVWEGEVGDLDKEADALNSAYFWSGYRASESPEVLNARKQLYLWLSGQLEANESMRADLLITIQKLDDSLLKDVFMGIAMLEDFLQGSSLEIAEQHFSSAAREVQVDSRIGMLVLFYLAKVQVLKGASFSREQMLSLANSGNLFAQVYISQTLSRVPFLGTYEAIGDNDISLFMRFGKTGYGVAQALAPLYYHLRINDQETCQGKMRKWKHMKKQAKQSAACGNRIGRVLWATMKANMELSEPSDCALAGALCYLSDDQLQAQFWFQRAGLDMGLAFLNMQSEQDPLVAVSWLTCMDYCEPHQGVDNLWLQLISDQVLHAKLTYSLLTFQLDEEAVLASVDFSKPKAVELVFAASRLMGSLEGDKFMQRVQRRYLDANGLRTLAGLYKTVGNLEAVMNCYLPAAFDKHCKEAFLDIGVMFLEFGNNGKAQSWAEKAGFPFDMLVLGLVEAEREKAIECFELAAQAGDPSAMWILGEILRSDEWLKNPRAMDLWRLLSRCRTFANAQRILKASGDTRCRNLKQLACPAASLVEFLHLMRLLLLHSVKRGRGGIK